MAKLFTLDHRPVFIDSLLNRCRYSNRNMIDLLSFLIAPSTSIFA